MRKTRDMAYNILIVDDSATTRAVIKRIISMAQVPTERVLEAPNGKAALEVLGANRIDLVLADLHMPEMNGVEMTRQILANEATKSIPVVVVSAEPNEQRLAELKREGIRGHIRKPFTPEVLHKLVCDVLQGGSCHA